MFLLLLKISSSSNLINLLLHNYPFYHLCNLKNHDFLLVFLLQHLSIKIHNTKNNFYFPLTRFWEILLGCLLFFSTKKILKPLSKINNDIEFNIVLGQFYKYKKNLRNELKKKLFKFKIYENQKNLNYLMKKNDLLITNSGITKYEAFAMRLPSLIISNSKKSNFDQKIFSNLGGSIFVGNFKSKKIQTLQKVIFDLQNNIKKIHRMQKNCKNYFDGKGPKRILNLIENEYEKNFISRWR